MQRRPGEFFTLEARALQRVLFNAILLVFGLLLVIEFAGAVLTPLVFILLAVVLVMGLNPLVARLEARFRVPRRLGALLLVLGLLALFGGLVAVLVPLLMAQGTRFAESLPTLIEGFEESLRTLGQRYPVLAPLGQGLPEVNFSRFLDGDMVGRLYAIASSVVGLLALTLVLLTLVLFLLMNPDPLVKGVLSGVPPHSRPVVERTMVRIGSQLGMWLISTMISSAVVGLLVGIGLALVGYKNAVLFGVVAAVTNPIPFLGPWLGISLPVLVAGAEGAWSLAFWAIVVLVVVQQIDASITNPLILGRTVHLHPASLLMGVLIFGSVKGIMGVFLTVPLLIIIKALYEEVYLELFKRPEVPEESVNNIVSAGQGEETDKAEPAPKETPLPLKAQEK
ncbi:sporulation integral membrane protein YtvI [Calidithermus terrae]|uniref:Sporulation integral membrane protein YtvI n=1 Tax=Calidithermus terrae TaxID=1408545 RepID=A0A399EX13_9DEIN|nr:AI-2E family transporter [Calidithermus terrae]RIH88190.1 sporulation integral membrane protein YtvI [Calidithermus terrae]